MLHEQIVRLTDKIRTYDKENLDEMLFATGEGVRLIAGTDRARIYLEDLTRGALSCVYASGPFASEIREITFPIISDQSLISRVLMTGSPDGFNDSRHEPLDLDREFTERFTIIASFLVPLVQGGRTFGVVCVDRDRPGAVVTPQHAELLLEFIAIVVENLNQARKHHQQLLLSRRVDEYKKREAAALMVQSAVRLIEPLALASVLVPAVNRTGGGALEILASHAEDPAFKELYDRQGSIALRKGGSLMSEFVRDDAIITDDRLLAPLYIPDLTRHALQKKALTEQMALRSLYVVPRYERNTRKVICLVNYFTRGVYRFTEFEQGLLQTHAEMVERVITEVGGEHLEIKILAEINDLLQERNEALTPFLTKVLSKATELIGADTGSIAIVQEREGEKWLVVEDTHGTIVGAKNKEWRKKYIPPFRVGGPELSLQERSLTGYVAWAKQARIIADVDDMRQHEGFHRSMSELIKSEIAVPVISDDEVIAVICLNSLKPDYFTEEHKRILQIIERLTSRHISDIQRIERLQKEVTRLATDVAYKDPQVSSYRLGNIIGNSRKAQEIVDFINTVSTPLFNRISLWSTNIIQEATIGLPSILVLGQTGAGKEFFFNNLYSQLNDMYRSEINPNGELPVNKTNIAAYSGELTYSELFGHKKGAFTGAYSDRKGILEEAQGGIVFLDEIGDADPKTQVQLLRFLDNGGFVRLGDNQQRYSRVLLVAATNRDLMEEIRKGNFREDLFHRLSELSVRVPSLNDRREDIPDLAVHFLGKLFRTYRGKDDAPEETPMLSAEARRILVNHTFKGNIRELRSILLRALFFRKGKVIEGEEISRAIRDGAWEAAPAAAVELNEQVAQEIMNAIGGRQGDFWSEVYEPYSASAISREVVRLVVDKTRLAAGRTMPEIARYLNAVSGDIQSDDVERKRFFKFKNFLYKTVRI